MKKLKPISFFRPTISKHDLTKVLECLVDENINQGNVVGQLKSKLEEILPPNSEVLLTHSPGMALYLIYHRIGLKEGDEVILSPLVEEYIPALTAYFKAKTIWVDIEKDKLTFDLNHLTSLITDKTKAIILSHLFGYPNFADLKKIIFQKEIKIIEDLSNSLGSRVKDSFSNLKKKSNHKKTNKAKVFFSDLKQLGGNYDFGFFSLASDKIITSVKGGGVISSKKLNLGPNSPLTQLKKKLNNAKGSEPNNYPKADAGLSALPPLDWGLDDLGAALALSELILLPKIVNKRYEIATYYQKTLERSECRPLISLEEMHYNFNYYPILTGNKFNLFKQVFLKHNLEVRDLVFGTAWQQLKNKEKNNLPNLSSLVKELIFLPIYPTLKLDEIDRITNLLRIKI